jgi:hypothetical protein
MTSLRAVLITLLLLPLGLLRAQDLHKFTIIETHSPQSIRWHFTSTSSTSRLNDTCWIVIARDSSQSLVIVATAATVASAYSLDSLVIGQQYTFRVSRIPGPVRARPVPFMRSVTEEVYITNDQQVLIDSDTVRVPVYVSEYVFPSFPIGK